MKKILLILFVFAHLLNAQSVLTVGQNGEGQFLTINEALVAAAQGDTIKVYPGSYYEFINVTKKVHLIGLDTTTIISYTSNGVVNFAAGSNGSSILGFSIRKPLKIANDVKEILIAANIFDSTNINGTLASGGAVIMKNNFRLSTISLTNTGQEKIAIYDNDFTGSSSSHVSITTSGNALIVKNRFAGGGTAVQTGAGTKILGNTITGMLTAGIRIDNAGNISITGNRISTSNSTGIYCSFLNSNLVLPRTQIRNNLFRTGSAFTVVWNLPHNPYGGANFTGINQTFAFNVVFSSGGVIQISEAANNKINEGNSSFLILGSIIMNCSNTFSARSFITVENSCFFGNSNNNIAGVGNIYSNPAFVSPDAGDFSLQTGSPCIDAAHTSEFDLDRTRADMGIYGGRYSQSNVMNQNGPAVIDLSINPVSGTQGTTINITGSGVSDIRTIQQLRNNRIINQVD